MTEALLAFSLTALKVSVIWVFCACALILAGFIILFPVILVLSAFGYYDSASYDY